MGSALLVPTDGGKGAAKVIDTALDLAECYDARVHALHVVDTEFSELLHDEPLREQLFERGEEATAEVAELADHRGVDAVTAVREGVPHEVILEYAREQDVDFVVMGVDKPTELGEYAVERLIENVLGGTTERVVRRSPAPVVTVRV